MSDCFFQVYNEIIDETDEFSLPPLTNRKSIIIESNFIGIRIYNCDFRFADFINTSFEHAHVEFCDFYRSLFIGQNMFNGCRFTNTTIPSYFDGSVIRKQNPDNKMTLQENKGKYHKFLLEKNKIAAFDVNLSLRYRYHEAEIIYRELSGLWSSLGYFIDANWAYKKVRKMERKKDVETRFIGSNYKLTQNNLEWHE